VRITIEKDNIEIVLATDELERLIETGKVEQLIERFPRHTESGGYLWLAGKLKVGVREVEAKIKEVQ
jgi:hypothetical protein